MSTLCVFVVSLSLSFIFLLSVHLVERSSIGSWCCYTSSFLRWFLLMRKSCLVSLPPLVFRWPSLLCWASCCIISGWLVIVIVSTVFLRMSQKLYRKPGPRSGSWCLCIVVIVVFLNILSVTGLSMASLDLSQNRAGFGSLVI